MNEEMIDISCDVCLDLIPLVRDHVASDDSKLLVSKHLQNCPRCQAEFESMTELSDKPIDDHKIIRSMRRSLYLTGLIFIIGGALLGVYLSNSMGMFYNFLIMPIVGGCGYFTLDKKWFVTPLGIFLITYIYIFIQNAQQGALVSGLTLDVLYNPLFFSGIYTGLTLLGVVIAALLRFALSKERKV